MNLLFYFFSLVKIKVISRGERVIFGSSVCLKVSMPFAGQIKSCIVCWNTIEYADSQEK